LVRLQFAFLRCEDKESALMKDGGGRGSASQDVVIDFDTIPIQHLDLVLTSFDDEGIQSSVGSEAEWEISFELGLPSQLGVGFERKQAVQARSAPKDRTVGSNGGSGAQPL
jgi:hypothetical protein